MTQYHDYEGVMSYAHPFKSWHA